MLRPSSCYELNNEPDDVRLDNKEEWDFARLGTPSTTVDSQHCRTIISSQQEEQQHEHHSAIAIDPVSRYNVSDSCRELLVTWLKRHSTEWPSYQYPFMIDGNGPLRAHYPFSWTSRTGQNLSFLFS